MTKQYVTDLVESDILLNGTFSQVRAKLEELEKKHIMGQDEFLSLQHESSYDYHALNVMVTRLETDSEYNARLAREAKEAVVKKKQVEKTREQKLKQFNKLKKELGL